MYYVPQILVWDDIFLLLILSSLLPKNNFRGRIPREFGGLFALEVLDLSSNKLDGTIPEELGAMPLLKQL